MSCTDMAIADEEPTTTTGSTRDSPQEARPSTLASAAAVGVRARHRAFSVQLPRPFFPLMRSFLSHYRGSVSKHASLENIAVGGDNDNADNNGALPYGDVQPLERSFKGGAWSTFTKSSIESIRSWSKETLPFGNLVDANRQDRIGSIKSKRQSMKRIKHSRLVQKNGDCNVSHMNVPKKERQYIRDIFTTLIDVKWRYILLVFASGFVCSWTFFAIIYYVICLVHGDLENHRNATWPSCVKNVYDFTSVFLFSVESQHTIGYGSRYATTNCSSAITTLCIQSICGLLIQSFMAGLVFAKLARAKKRAGTLIFSKNACISLRDGQLCFLFRVGDMRNTHLVESHLRLQLIKKRTTVEGEVLPLHQYDMDIGYDVGFDRIFLVWPITICHVIDLNSPLYDTGDGDMATAQFEIIVILEGIVESTGMTVQARTSYLPSEVMWGHRFEKLITFQKQNGEYQIDYSRFHKTYAVNTPKCSAKELDAMKASGGSLGSQYYQKSTDDGCDSETYTPSCTREASFIDEDMRTGPSNHTHQGLSPVDEQRTLLLPQCKKAPTAMKVKSSSRSTLVSAGNCRPSSSCSSVRFHNGGDPPEIVVMAPSSPSLTATISDASRNTSPILRQHDIM